VEGPHPVAEALAAGADLEVVFAAPGDPLADRAVRAGIEVLPVTPRVLDRLSTAETPQSPVAVLRVRDLEIPDDGDLLVAWGVSDPGNVGTLIRTAAAFGWGFVAGPDGADPWAPKVLRSAAGAHFQTFVGRVEHLERLGGRTVVATVPAGGAPPQAVRTASPMALLVGDEGAGLPAGIVATADLRVTIPMPGGTESLNAAVAGAILVYEATSGRGAPFGGTSGAS